MKGLRPHVGVLPESCPFPADDLPHSRQYPAWLTRNPPVSRVAHLRVVRLPRGSPEIRPSPVCWPFGAIPPGGCPGRTDPCPAR